MPVNQMLSAVLKRDRAIVAIGLVGVVGLSWAYLVYMDWGMRHMGFGMGMVIMPAMEHWTAWDLLLVFLMWTIMMVAMMVPAASPVIIIFAQINRRRREQCPPFILSGLFLLGYLVVWTGFSALATVAQWGLLSAALVSPMMESTMQSPKTRMSFQLAPAGSHLKRGRRPLEGIIPIDVLARKYKKD